MDDSPTRTDSFEASWEPVGRSVGVGAAAVIALIGVLSHVPVWLACLRGALALVLVIALLRVASLVAGALPARSTAPRRDNGRENGREKP